MSSLYIVEVAKGLTYECEAADEAAYDQGSRVVIQLDKHKDCGRVLQEACPKSCGCEQQPRSKNKKEAKPARARILRNMTLVDEGRSTENEARTRSMFRTAQRKIDEHRLAMKLVNGHYALDKSVVIFQFTAEERVDFRNLVKDLSGALRCRIEMRQIGVRDEAAIHGGIGPCGRPFCCSSVIDKFRSVNVRMAKVQRLSLNPNSVSGGCGRLKCCLRYEVEGYREIFKCLPKSGQVIDTPQGPARVLDCDAMTETIRVRLEEGGENPIATYPAKELGYGLNLK